MLKDKISYELGVLMAMEFTCKVPGMKDSVSTIIKSLKDEEIVDEFLIKGIKNELQDEINNFLAENKVVNTFQEAVTSNDEFDTDDIVKKIVDGYELNIDINPFTDFDYEKLNNFFEKNEKLFVEVPNLYGSNLGFQDRFLFDDYYSAKNMIDSNKDLFTYTLVEGDDDSLWIVDGWHYVNRHGYFFTTEKLELPKEGLRAW